MLQRFAWLSFLIAAAGACGGDDGHKQPTIHPQMPHVAIAPDAQIAPPAKVPLAPAPLTEAMTQPYFTAGDAKDGAAAFALEQWGKAQTSFTAALAAANQPAELAHVSLVLGLVEEKQGAYASAVTHLTAARAALPILADYITFHLARATYLAHAKGALELARTVDRASIVGADAELLVGDILRDGTDKAAILAHYTDYLKRRPNGPHKSEVRFYIAEAGGDPAMYRLIAIEDPLSSWAKKAKPHLAADLALTAAEQITQADVLFDAMRNPESEAAYAAALAIKGITPAETCAAAYNRAQSRFKARDRQGAAPLFDEATTACHAAGNTDLEIKSHYQAARSYSYFGEHDRAIKEYQAAETIDPKHSYADDAMLREAEEWTVLGNGAKVEEVLSALPTKFPDGDNTAEAMWRLGWKNWRDGKTGDAIKWWKKQIELVPHDDNYFGEGQAQYWLGRAYLERKQKTDALASWQACVREYPASYYALQALNRLKETDAKTYEALVAEISAEPKDFDPKAPAFTFKPREVYAEPGFARAIEPLKLGLGEPAGEELRELGLAAPKDKKRVDDPDKQEQLWAMAWLYDRAGQYATSHWPTRWHILDYRRAWTTGANRARWEIAYPKAYWDLLSRHAAINKVPIAMQIGIVREESAFDPLDESYANAVGLTQMIPPTAKDNAKGTGIDPTRENLRDPEKNVTIGSRFLGSLYRTWKGFTLLVPTSYNAGPAGVRRMLKVRGTWAGDEFVEGIVDDQARNYTKRVLSSFFTYGWLYEQNKVPEIPNVIPAKLLPKK